MIFNIIKNSFKPKMKKPLGRWTIKRCKKEIDVTILNSNHDHCGASTCESPLLLKQKTNKIFKIKHLK